MKYLPVGSLNPATFCLNLCHTYTPETKTAIKSKSLSSPILILGANNHKKLRCI